MLCELLPAGTGQACPCGQNNNEYMIVTSAKGSLVGGSRHAQRPHNKTAAESNIPRHLLRRRILFIGKKRLPFVACGYALGGLISGGASRFVAPGIGSAFFAPIRHVCG